MAGDEFLGGCIERSSSEQLAIRCPGQVVRQDLGIDDLRLQRPFSPPDLLDATRVPSADEDPAAVFDTATPLALLIPAPGRAVQPVPGVHSKTPPVSSPSPNRGSSSAVASCR